MIMIILTFLSALAISAVSAWFSIVGIMAIFAAAATPALIMGAVLELGKLVSTSWLYRNWSHAPLLLRAPLVMFTIILMFITSMGCFGFLSKAHIEQGATAGNNTAKIERLDQKIATETAHAADATKLIAQLDAAVASYTARDKIKLAVALRRSQAAQRKQLAADEAVAQKLIDQYNDQKAAMQAEIRSYELEVGPVKYIAALIYKDPASSMEATVRIVTLIIVSVFDPFAVVLLIAANYSLTRRKYEKDEEEKSSKTRVVPDMQEQRPKTEALDTNIHENNTSDQSVDELRKMELPEKTLSEKIDEKKEEIAAEVFDIPLSSADYYEKHTSNDTNETAAQAVGNIYGSSAPIFNEKEETLSETINAQEEDKQEMHVLGQATSVESAISSESVPTSLAQHPGAEDSTVRIVEMVDIEPLPIQEEITDHTTTIEDNVTTESTQKDTAPSEILGNYFNKRNGFVTKPVQQVIAAVKPNLPRVVGWLGIDKRR